MPRVAIVLALSLFVGGCTSSDDSAESAGVTGQLVVVDGSGNVAVVAPDGSETVAVTSDSDSGATYSQPIWDPTARFVSFARQSTVDGFAMVTYEAAARSSTQTGTAANPFYAFWSPDGSRLAYLSATQERGLALDVLDVETGATQRIDTGQPFYFSWSGDGSQLAVHVGRDRMEILGFDGSSQALDTPGAFQAPQWTDQGIVHVVRRGDAQTLVLTQDENSTVLAQVVGSAIFGMNRDGTMIAIQVFLPDDRGLSVAAQPAPLLPSNRLVVLDIATGEIATVFNELTASFFWDPTGRRLLVLSLGDEPGMLLWSVWAEGETSEIVQFVPSAVFLGTYLPFFDQYAQSMTLWAPDGSAFAFPGSVNSEAGIWVQTVDGTAPTLVSDGVWVSWSP